MRKFTLCVVVLGASSFFAANAAQPQFNNTERQLIKTWSGRHYRSLTGKGKEILLSSVQANLKMLEACKESLQHEGGVSLLSQEAFLRVLKLWTHSSELIKQETALEVVDVVRSVNALNQLRLDWLRKVIEKYQKKKPNILERIFIRFTQKGQFRLYRDLNTLMKWSNEIVEQFMLFERELIKSL